MLRAPAGAPVYALIALLVAGSAGALPAPAAANEALDAAFARLWAAETDQDTVVRRRRTRWAGCACAVLPETRRLPMPAP